MSSILPLSLAGYNLLGCTIENKNGQAVDSDFLKRYHCVQCHLILREACQMNCGDRICRSCVPSISFKCPSCGEDVDPTSKQGFFNDRSCQKDIKELVVVCKCGEKLNLDPWEAHSDTCQEIVKDKPKLSQQDQAQIIQGVRRVESDLRITKSEITELKKSTSKLTKKMDAIEKEMRGLKTTMEDIQRSGGRQGFSSGSASSSSRHSSSDFQRINEKLAQLNEIVTQLVADVEQHKGTITQMNTTVDNISSTVPRYENILEELNLKLEILEVKSCSGIYVWKVNELGRRVREARTGRTISLYSPPLYTSIHGYRLCLRAYLNGDGSGQGTHISLFAVIMRSEYDDLLAWPFAHRVTMSLVNQAHPLSPEKSYTRKFTPNPESSSFQKPEDTFNIASGFPEFAPVSALSDPQFCKNDTIFFRVKMDPPNAPSGPDQVNYTSTN